MLPSFVKNPRYVVITEQDVFIGRSEEDVNKQAGGLIDLAEYKRIGEYYVSLLNPSDLEFVQDKRRFANIPWRTLGKTEKTQSYLIYLLLLLQLIILVKG